MSFDASRAYDFGEPTPALSEPRFLMTRDLRGELYPWAIKWPDPVPEVDNHKPKSMEGGEA